MNQEGKELSQLKHERISDSCVVEWVFPEHGTPYLTFDRKSYYNAYSDRDKLSDEQLRILRKEGAMGCPEF